MVSMRALECLVTIVEHGSLTKAAAALHMPPSALSHQIAAIERELGTPVLERLATRDQADRGRARRRGRGAVALAAADRAVIAGRRVAARTGRRIRIACAETMTAWVLVPVLRGWRRRFPDVGLDLKEYTSADRMLEVLGPAARTSWSGHRRPGPRSTPKCSAARRSWWSPRPSTGFAVWAGCRWANCPPNRWFTTTPVTGLGCGSTSSPRGGVSCCRSRHCGQAARGRPRNWPRPAWGWQSCRLGAHTGARRDDPVG